MFWEFFFCVALLIVFIIAMVHSDTIDPDKDKAINAHRIISIFVVWMIIGLSIMVGLVQSAPSARDVYENKTELIYHIRGNDTVSYDIVYKDKQSK